MLHEVAIHFGITLPESVATKDGSCVFLQNVAAGRTPVSGFHRHTTRGLQKKHGEILIRPTYHERSIYYR